MRKLIFLVTIVIFSSGCMKLRQLAHLGPMLTLKSVSDNGEVKKQYVTEYDARFEQLLEAAKSGTLQQYSNQSDFLEHFGTPIYKRTMVRNAQMTEEWMYRYATKLSNSERVYLYFDDTGKLISWKHVNPPQTSLPAAGKEAQDEQILQETTAEAGSQKI